MAQRAREERGTKAKQAKEMRDRLAQEQAHAPAQRTGQSKAGTTGTTGTMGTAKAGKTGMTGKTGKTGKAGMAGKTGKTGATGTSATPADREGLVPEEYNPDDFE